MEAKLCYIGHTLMENRNGLLVDARLTRVAGHAERLAALDMIEPRADRPEAITLGGDKGFDAADFVMELREINVTPHVARNTTRRSAIDGPPAILVMQRASASENASKKASAGSRPSRDCGKRGTEVSNESDGPSLSQPRPTI